MALLQGYLLRHKDDAESALAQVGQLVSGEYAYRPPSATTSNNNNTDNIPKNGSETAADVSTADKKVRRVAPRSSVREISAEGVDRMVFNPQSADWEQDVQHLPVKLW